MEIVVSTVMFPCKYSTSGCAVSPLYAEKEEHEESCEFGPYSCQCPWTSCKWQGSLEQIATHLDMTHSAFILGGGKDVEFFVGDINHPRAVICVLMQYCFEHYFVTVIKKQKNFHGEEQFFAIVQLIGSRKQAENFAYKLKLIGQRKCVTWEATTTSICEGFSAAIINSECFVIDTGFAQLFTKYGDNLGINVTISMV
jgi:hypothetical protein